jgi:hypothetical protein
MPLPLMELGDEESSAGFEDPIHLGDGSLLIIFGHVMQCERAGDGIEGGVSERELLREGDLEVRRHSVFVGSGGGTVDHLGAWVNAVNRAGR